MQVFNIELRYAAYAQSAHKDIRYLYTRILLLRPVLLLPLDYPDVIEEGFNPLDDELIMHAIDLCATACYRLIETLHSNLTSAFRPADWHVIYSEKIIEK